MVESDSERDLYTEEQILGDGLEVLSQCDESVDDPEEYDLKFHFDSVYSDYTEEEEEQEELWDGNQEINDLLAPFIGENYTPKRSLLFGANEPKWGFARKNQKLTLHIENLPLQTTKVQLFKFFIYFGPIRSIRLRTYDDEPLRDRELSEQTDPCFNAYIVFHEEAALPRVMMSGNREFHGHHIRISQPLHPLTAIKCHGTKLSGRPMILEKGAAQLKFKRGPRRQERTRLWREQIEAAKIGAEATNGSTAIVAQRKKPTRRLGTRKKYLVQNTSWSPENMTWVVNPTGADQGFGRGMSRRERAILFREQNAAGKATGEKSMGQLEAKATNKLTAEIVATTKRNKPTRRRLRRPKKMNPQDTSWKPESVEWVNPNYHSLQKPIIELGTPWSY